MTAGRWIRVLWVKVLMIAVAGYLFWLGIRILTHPSPNIPAWIGWFCVAGAALKASLWSIFAVTLIRHPEAVMAARHWD